MSESATSGNPSDNSLNAVMAGVKQPDSDIPQLLQAITQKARQLDQQEKQVEKQASDLEYLIRIMSLNPKELVRRKPELEKQARAIRERRLALMVTRKQLENIRKNALRLSDAQERPKPVVPEQRDRIRVRMAVEVTLHTETHFYAGLSQNISEGGLFVATYEHLDLGTPLDLTITLPGQPAIEVRGEVRWTREASEYTADFSPGVGVAFCGLPDAAKTVIETFLRTRSPLLYEMG